VVLDSTLFDVVNVTDGLEAGGLVIINTGKRPEEFKIKNATVKTVDATTLALQTLGADIVNTAMLGAYAAFTGDVAKESILEAVKENFPAHLAEKNIKLVEMVYEKAKTGK
jgi:2-oxoacid:acceptor oxidoreductase gamma subunit (pyruvate/2-ketoisovalerate family)